MREGSGSVLEKEWKERQGCITLGGSGLHKSRLMPNKTTRKLEVLTSVFRGVSVCASRIG
jgi:hypothetical protein